MSEHMNKPMTKQEWFEYLEKTWDAAQKEAWVCKMDDAFMQELDPLPMEKSDG